MSREEHLDDLIERCLSDASLPSDASADDAARLEAAMAVARLNAIEPPLALAERVEARVRMQARAHHDGRTIGLQPPYRPRVGVRRSMFHRAWIGSLMAAAVVALAVLGVSSLATRSLPGDPLYPLKRFEQQMAVSNANGPADRANVQIAQLQSQIADLQSEVNDGRSDADILQALNVVVASTRDSKAAVAALPAGPSRDNAEQALENTLRNEQTTLYSLLGRVDWSLRLAFTGQLGALGASVPTVTKVTVTSGSDNTLTLRLTGTNFAPGARLVINGRVRGTVSQNTGTTLTATINESDWHEDESAVGVQNPDGTAAQKIISDDGQHDGSDDGGGGDDHDGQRTPTPGFTPTPTSKSGDGGGSGSDDGGGGGH
jgi:hypothetical protein